MEVTDCFAWWKSSVFYHIYPKSFKDSNKDGVGDIPGIIEKLDYLFDLGIDAIWLSPVYKSPMVDFGYDISSYTQVDPLFGTFEHLEELIAEAHKRNIKVIMDLVMNHTSDQHPWFLESRSSTDNPKRDWYLWKDPKNGKVPNNWKTNFGSSAWKYDEPSSQYYYHSFFKEQPDLNWRNEDMKRAFFAKIRFWLDLGIDGFRLDVVNMIVKDASFKNHSFIRNLLSNKGATNKNQAYAYEIVKEFRLLLNSYGDKLSLGEVYVLPPGDPGLVGSFLGQNDDLLHLAFDFSFIFAPWSARRYYHCIVKWYRTLSHGGWPCFVMSNHDLGRYANLADISANNYAKAKILAMLLLTLRGTPFIYYGDEIGMQNTTIQRKKMKDPYGKKFWPIYKGRDKSRTPMQWDASEYAGFSTVSPWLPLNKLYKSANVEAEQLDQSSILDFYKQLIKIRKTNKALSIGEWYSVSDGSSDILSYRRKYEDEVVLVVLNFAAEKRYFPYYRLPGAKTLFSTHRMNGTVLDDDMLFLNPLEASLFLLTNVKNS